MQFSKHYTLDEARSLLPQIRNWLAELERLRLCIRETEKPLNYPVASGRDVGGESVNNLVRQMAAIKSVANEFSRRDIQLKDPARGLIDFPTLRNGQEVFLCWEKDDEDIEFWHELDSDESGRERL
jgi:hypothetical protein